MNPSNSTFILRLIVAIILLVHSVPGMFDGGINNFGKLYLDQVGFAPVGIYLAWLIKLSHVVFAACLLADRFIRIPAIITILILVMGIIMVHYPEGWYVVGGGRNGMEFNILLIAAIVTIMFPRGLVSVARQ